MTSEWQEVNLDSKIGCDSCGDRPAELKTNPIINDEAFFYYT